MYLSGEPRVDRHAGPRRSSFFWGVKVLRTVMVVNGTEGQFSRGLNTE